MLNHRNTAKEDKRQDSRGSYNVWNESGTGGLSPFDGGEGKDARKRDASRCATWRRGGEQNV